MNTKAKHTPGVNLLAALDTVAFLLESGAEPLLVAKDARATIAKATALMATGPDLLAALETLVKETECYCVPELPEICGHCSARAAIAKAKGAV